MCELEISALVQVKPSTQMEPGVAGEVGQDEGHVPLLTLPCSGSL